MRSTLRCLLLAATLVPAAGAAPAERHTAAPEATLEQARSLLRAGDAAAAAERFAAVLAEEPSNAAAAAGRVEALLELDRWEDALAEARELHARAPSLPLVGAALAEALFRAGRLEEAEALLDVLAEHDDATGRALSLLGVLRAARGGGAEAVELMRRAVERAGEDRRVWLRAAEATASRAQAVGRLERYLELSAGDDADRIEGARGTLRVLRALGERAVWVVHERPERLEIPLELLRGGDGAIHGGVVRVRLGPKRRAVRLLLDSGSSGLFVGARATRRGGFEPIAEETTFGGGGGRRHASRRGLFPTVALGGLEFSDALATSISGEVDPHGRYHGVLGLSVFDGYRVTLDLAVGRVLLEPPSAEPLEGSDYWSVSGQMLVRAAAEGGPDGLFLFDTGATLSIVDLEFARGVEGARLSDPARVRGFGGDVEGVRVVEGLRLEFQGLHGAGHPLRAADLSLRSRLGGVEVAGYLGLDLLRDTQVVVDTRARRLHARSVE